MTLGCVWVFFTNRLTSSVPGPGISLVQLSILHYIKVPGPGISLVQLKILHYINSILFYSIGQNLSLTSGEPWVCCKVILPYRVPGPGILYSLQTARFLHLIKLKSSLDRSKFHYITFYYTAKVIAAPHLVKVPAQNSSCLSEQFAPYQGSRARDTVSLVHMSNLHLMKVPGPGIS
jgi:hypothetical protein